MKKTIFLSLAALLAVAGGIVGMGAFESHVINVTAQIDNALSVDTTDINFGMVFPQEELDETITVSLSESFNFDDTADDVNYVIKQKPKCAEFNNGEIINYGRVTEDGSGNYICEDDGYEILPVLCAYLSKHDLEKADQNDEELDAFHGPAVDWTPADTEANVVNGRLAKSQNDLVDEWNIDLKVPCFMGECAQDWDDYVYGINPSANPDDYIQPTENKNKVFGCDLWIEVSEISRVEGGPETASIALGKKDKNWNWLGDYATLTYNLAGETFDYSFVGHDLDVGIDYSLIYYADPWPGDGTNNSTGAFIDNGVVDGSGNLNLSGSIDLNTDLPNADDDNYPTGAKIWLVPSAGYDQVNHKLTTWNPTAYLHEYNLITYNDTDL